MLSGDTTSETSLRRRGGGVIDVGTLDGWSETTPKTSEENKRYETKETLHPHVHDGINTSPKCWFLHKQSG